MCCVQRVTSRYLSLLLFTYALREGLPLNHCTWKFLFGYAGSTVETLHSPVSVFPVLGMCDTLPDFLHRHWRSKFQSSGLYGSIQTHITTSCNLELKSRLWFCFFNVEILPLDRMNKQQTRDKLEPSLTLSSVSMTSSVPRSRH